MANHALPTTTDLYANVLTYLHARIDDSSKWYDSALSYTNPPTGVVRWNSTSLTWQKNTGTPAAPVWGALSTSYAININGTVGATTAATGAFTTLSTSGVASLAASSTVGGSAIVTVGGTQTFTGVNTFTNANPIVSAKIGPVSGTQMHTLPAVTSDTIALIAASQTFTNKTYSAGALSGTFSGNHTLSGQVTFNEATAPIIAAKIGPSNTQQHTLPVITSDTIALLAAAQTFTNKTLTGATLTGSAFNGTVGATTPSTGSFTTLSASGAITAGTYQTFAAQTAYATSLPSIWHSTSGYLQVGAGDNGFAINNKANSATWALFSPTGLAVTGALSASGDVTLSSAAATIKSNTSDGSDSSLIAIAGGGLLSESRGAYIQVAGNENTFNGTGGDIQVTGGSVAGAKIKFRTAGTNVGEFSSSGLAVTGQISATGTVTVGSGASGVSITPNAGGTGVSLIYNASLTPSGTNYALGFGTANTYLNGVTNVQILANGSVTGIFSSTGLAVTGALSATGKAGIGRVESATTGLIVRGLGTTSATRGFVVENGSGTELLIQDDAGNLGLGVTPSAWGTGRNLEVGNINFNTAGTLSANAYNNAGWKYETSSNPATSYIQSGGTHTWNTAPSGTAGNPITFTERMNLSSLGLAVTGAVSGTSGSFTFNSASSVLGARATVELKHTGGQSSALALTASGTSNLCGLLTDAPANGTKTGDLSFLSGVGSINATLDAAGNLGLGVTPSAWAAGWVAQQIGYSYALMQSTSVAQFYLMNNAYYDGSFKYKNTSVAGSYEHGAGGHVFKNAPSGTAGTTITFTQVMTLDASGNLLVGTATANPYPTQGLSIYGNNGGSALIGIGHASGTASGNAYLTFAYNGSGIGSIGQNGTTGVTLDTGVGGDIRSSSQNGGQLAGLRNRFINGDFRVDQRNNYAVKTLNSVTGATTGYSADRWYFFASSSTTQALNATVDTAVTPSGVTSGRMTIATTTAGSAGTIGFGQRIENVNTYPFYNQTITVSMVLSAEASTTFTWKALYPTISGNAWNGVPGTGLPDGNSATISTSTWNVTTTPTRFTATFNAGTSLNGIAFQVTRSASASGQTMVVQQAQLEVGPLATTFEVLPYNLNLILCQRYLPTISMANGIGNAVIASGQAYSTTAAIVVVPFTVIPRLPPSGCTVSAAAYFNITQATLGLIAPTAIAFNGATLSAAELAATGASGLVAGNATTLRGVNALGLILFTGCEI